jgi:hypothetical protein
MRTGPDDNQSILELAATAVDGASKDGNLINPRAVAHRLMVHRDRHTLKPEEIEGAIIKLALAKGVTIELGDPNADGLAELG